jgi:hypothetical protein
VNNKGLFILIEPVFHIKIITMYTIKELKENEISIRVENNEQFQKLMHVIELVTNVRHAFPQSLQLTDNRYRFTDDKGIPFSEIQWEENEFPKKWKLKAPLTKNVIPILLKHLNRTNGYSYTDQSGWYTFIGRDSEGAYAFDRNRSRGHTLVTEKQAIKYLTGEKTTKTKTKTKYD